MPRRGAGVEQRPDDCRNGKISQQGMNNADHKRRITTCLRNERTFGRFARSFRLPDDVNPGAVTAEFRDGLLQIGLTKREEALPKVIDVKIV